MLVSDIQCQQKDTLGQRMIDKGEVVTPVKLNSNEISEFNNGILFARPLHPDAVMNFSVTDGDGTQYRKKNIRQAIILSTLEEVTLHFKGEWFVETMEMSRVTTLFSFLDFQAKNKSEFNFKLNCESDAAVVLHMDKCLALMPGKENKTFMEMTLATMLDPMENCLESLFSFIRGVESYWISYFLLSQVMNGDKENDAHKICNASKVYGVSESYFRKLCHHAFTRGPKKQLRIWRAAHSALQLIEKDHSIATIAGDNGYASSSHFSSEIKSLFGITPREFKKLEGLFHE